MKLYVVIMRRWGDEKSHHYVLGVFSDEKLAEQAGNDEEEIRGGKYEAWIKDVELNESYRIQHIKLPKLINK